MLTIFSQNKTLFLTSILVSPCEYLNIKDLQKQRMSFDSQKNAPPFFLLKNLELRKYFPQKVSHWGKLQFFEEKPWWNLWREPGVDGSLWFLSDWAFCCFCLMTFFRGICFQDRSWLWPLSGDWVRFPVCLLCMGEWPARMMIRRIPGDRGFSGGVCAACFSAWSYSAPCGWLSGRCAVFERDLPTRIANEKTAPLVNPGSFRMRTHFFRTFKEPHRGHWNS